MVSWRVIALGSLILARDYYKISGYEIILTLILLFEYFFQKSIIFENIIFIFLKNKKLF